MSGDMFGVQAQSRCVGIRGRNRPTDPYNVLIKLDRQAGGVTLLLPLVSALHSLR